MVNFTPILDIFTGTRWDYIAYSSRSPCSLHENFLHEILPRFAYVKHIIPTVALNTKISMFLPTGASYMRNNFQSVRSRCVHAFGKGQSLLERNHKTQIIKHILVRYPLVFITPLPIAHTLICTLDRSIHALP